MAAYNGSKYISQQIGSILAQLGQDDELIVCDDKSTDSTLAILNAFEDRRIKIHAHSNNIGHVKNFESALMLAKGDVIALSDQDDIWLPGRLLKMREALTRNPRVCLVASNFELIDKESKLIGVFHELREKPRSRFVRIFRIFNGTMPYFGCTFMFTKEFLAKSLPFPKSIEAHDVWLALLANTYGETFHLMEATVKRRIHDKNLTPERRRKLSIVLSSRCRLALNYLTHLIR